MDGKFENIFEKYNITCNVPKKHQKTSKTSIQSNKFQKNADTLRGNSCSTKNDSGNFKTTSSNIANTTKNSNLNSSYYFNNSAKRKYNCATRYKTLEVIPVQNVPRPVKCSTTKCYSSSDNISAGESSPKETCIEKHSAYLMPSILETIDNRSVNIENTDIVSKMDLSFNEFSTSNKSHNLSCNFNFGRRKHSAKTQDQTQCLRYNKLNVTTATPKLCNNFSTPFEKPPNIKCFPLNQSNNILDDSFNNTIACSSPKPSQIIDTPTLTQESVDNVTTELDLLIELIEREEKNKAKRETHKQNVSNSDILPPTKSCLKGGYEELFERVLKNETVRDSFLKHDRKIGLRKGIILSVVEMKTSYGVTIAVVKSEDLHKTVCVLVPQEMVPQLTSRTLIEAFFDDRTLPYKLQYNDDYLDIYLEPYKLLVV